MKRLLVRSQAAHSTVYPQANYRRLLKFLNRNFSLDCVVCEGQTRCSLSEQLFEEVHKGPGFICININVLLVTCSFSWISSQWLSGFSSEFISHPNKSIQQILYSVYTSQILLLSWFAFHQLRSPHLDRSITSSCRTETQFSERPVWFEITS